MRATPTRCGRLSWPDEQAPRHLGVAALRDADLALLRARGAGLGAVVQRRARHVISENQRTLAAAHALRAGDLPRLGRLMAQSHTSMRDDFEITTPAIDQLVHLLQDAIGSAGGASMTGGGFGGCVVAFMPSHRVEAARTAVERGYRSPRGDAGVVMLCQPAAGGRSLCMTIKASRVVARIANPAHARHKLSHRLTPVQCSVPACENS